MCKVKYEDSSKGYVTLGELRRVNIVDLEIFTEYLTDRVNLILESYKVENCSDVVFTYVVKDGLADDSRKLIKPISAKVESHSYNSYKLPYPAGSL